VKSVRHAPRATVNAMQLSSGWNDESMRIVVLSDTHAPRFWKRCPPGVAEHLFAAEVILHAGDVCVASVLEELSAYAPVHAVLGNNDGPDVSAWGASETAELNLAGLRVGMIHDAGPGRVGWRDFAAGSPESTLSSSVTPISRCRQSTVISGSSTPAHPPTNAASLIGPSVSSRSSTVISPAPRLSHCPDRGDERSA
jgi:Calcineurin-like phosphoesterase superfamily domain